MRASRFLAWSLALSLGACAELPAMDLSECGNQIVEPGEDCDTFPEGACRGPSDQFACRFTCTVDADCADGWGCSVDRYCRRGTGKFAQPNLLEGVEPGHLVLADFDADDRQDVMVAGEAEIAINYLNDEGKANRVIRMGAQSQVPAAGQLTDPEGGDDFAMILTTGLGVMRGQEDSTLTPTSYSSLALGAFQKNIRVLGIDARQNAGAEDSGDEILFLSGTSLSRAIGGEIVTGFPRDAGDLVRTVPVGNLDETSVCEEYVLAYLGESTVYIHTSCDEVGADGQSKTFKQTLDPIAQLTVSEPISNVLLAEVNGDDHLDLLVATSYDPMLGEGELPPELIGSIYVAFGVGTGKFHSDPTSIPTDGTEDGQTSFLVEAEGIPLAAGALGGGDQYAIVTSAGLLLLGPEGVNGVETKKIAAPSGGWTSGYVRDINGNDLPDILAMQEGSRIDFFNGAGDGRLNRSEIPTKGPTTPMALGDFDGDLLLDVAFGEGTELSIAFGRPFGTPAPPVSVGRLPRIERMIAGDWTPFDPDAPFDGVTDLVVISNPAQDTARTMATFFGSTDRQFQSPYRFGRLARPDRVVVGQFDDAKDHLDLAAFTWTDPDPNGGGGRQLWLLPSQADAQLNAPSPDSVVTVPPGVYLEDAPMVTVDLDGDGIDEFVFVGAGDYETEPDPCLSHSPMFIYRSQPEGDSRRWNLVDQRLMSGQFANNYGLGCAVAGGGPEGPNPPPEIDPYTLEVFFGHLTVADVVGDSSPDVVALGIETDPTTYLGTSKIVVFENLGNGALAAERPLALPDQVVPTGFAILQADTDPRPEIVILTPFHGYVADVDRESLTLVGERKIAGVTGGVGAEAGDVNGDGVQDVVVRTNEGVEVLLGIPAL